MDAEHIRRVAHNEARYRAVNERMTQARAEFQAGSSADFPVICECAVTECQEMISVGPDQYAHVRSDPTWFVVVPDHVIHAAETPIERHAAYWIVAKIGLGGEIAESLA